MDNCEHLIGAAADLVREVIKAALGVRVIVTSREPLSVQGEHVIPLAPLELPRPDSIETLTQLRQNEAVRLFTERAAAASGTFELTGSNQVAVVDLCRRAALPRHQTLETAIEWSHDLLTRDEQRLLRQLSVFAGRFSLEDVAGICVFDTRTEGTTLDLLSSLVDKSLVMKDDLNGLAWYRLRETMREYAHIRLRPRRQSRDLVGLVLDHAGKHRRRPLAGRVAPVRRWRATGTRLSLGHSRLPGRASVGSRCCQASARTSRGRRSRGSRSAWAVAIVVAGINRRTPRRRWRVGSAPAQRGSGHDSGPR